MSFHEEFGSFSKAMWKFVGHKHPLVIFHIDSGTVKIDENCQFIDDMLNNGL